MGDSQLSKTRPEVYERLIDRLGLALETARTAASLRDQAPAELELRGLSQAEFEVIRTWLQVHAQGRLGQTGSDPQAATGTARIVWLKDRKRSGAAAGPRAPTFR